MKSIDRRKFIIALLMFGGAGLALGMKPTQKIADQGPRVDLETMIPAQFADWRIDPSVIPITVSPDVQAQLDALYDQTLSRTYINSKGQRVMLSIAYGGDQSGDKTQVHRPEFCYAAQGFQLSNIFESHLATNQGELLVRRLLATNGARNEPITYWITVGDNVTLPGIGRKLFQMRYGVTGKVPDGMLVRVSSIDQDNNNAYRLQDTFVNNMLDATNEQNRVRLAGRFIR